MNALFISPLDKQGTGGTEYEFYDGLGDVYQTLNAAGNYVLSGEVSDDFGQHFGPTGTLGTDDLFYKWRGDYGYRWDGDGLWTGSYNEPIVEVGARYYIPAMGIFITKDKKLSQRPYEYCGGDPVNRVDPSGNSWITDLWKKLFGNKDLVVNQGLGLKIDLLLWDLDVSTGFVFSAGDDGLHGGLYASEGNGGGPGDIGGAGLYIGGGGVTGIGVGSIAGFDGPGESFGGEFNNLGGAANWNSGYGGVSLGTPFASGGYGAGAYGNVTRTGVIPLF